MTESYLLISSSFNCLLLFIIITGNCHLLLLLIHINDENGLSCLVAMHPSPMFIARYFLRRHKHNVKPVPSKCWTFIRQWSVKQILKPKYSLDLYFSSTSSAAICTNIVKLQFEEQQLANEMPGYEQLRQSISFEFVMWVERGETTCATRRRWLHPVARLIDKFIALDMELQTFRVSRRFNGVMSSAFYRTQNVIITKIIERMHLWWERREHSTVVVTMNSR